MIGEYVMPDLNLGQVKGKNTAKKNTGDSLRNKYNDAILVIQVLYIIGGLDIIGGIYVLNRI